jgi:toxin ParE1/3/4
MAGYVFHPRANLQQDSIWKDTVEKWGEKQAIAYIDGLHAHLQRLSETRALWRPLPSNLVVPSDLKIQVYCSRFERHYVLFRELPSGKLGVMSILHDRMDLPARLSEDLARLIDPS